MLCIRSTEIPCPTNCWALRLARQKSLNFEPTNQQQDRCYQNKPSAGNHSSTKHTINQGNTDGSNDNEQYEQSNNNAIHNNH